MRLLLRVQCAISALLLMSSAAMADSIYPFLPPLPPGVAPGDVKYQTYGQVNGVAWSAGRLPIGAGNVGEWWIGFSTAVTSYTATMENVGLGVYPSQFSTTFPYAINVSAGPLSISLVNALTVQLAQSVSGTSTLAIMNPYSPLAPLTFTSLTASLGADAPEAPTALLIGLGLLAFALVRRLARNNRPVIDYVLRQSRSCDVTRCLNGRLILPNTGLELAPHIFKNVAELAHNGKVPIEQIQLAA